MQGSMLAMYALPLHPVPAGESSTSASAEPDSSEQPPAAKRPRSSGEGPSGGGGGGRGRMPVLAWVGRTADVLGKFDVARAKELGIPPGT